MQINLVEIWFEGERIAYAPLIVEEGRSKDASAAVNAAWQHTTAITRESVRVCLDNVEKEGEPGRDLFVLVRCGIAKKLKNQEEAPSEA